MLLKNNGVSNKNITYQPVYKKYYKKIFVKYKTMPCGTKCCMKTFTIEKQWGAVYNKYVYQNINAPAVSTYSECTSNPVYQDCLNPSQTRPCTGDCDE